MMIPNEAPVLAAASDSEASALEDLQAVLGEGPCLVAFGEQRPVLVADLGDGAVRRWPAYSSAAQELGVRAVFAFPLQVGAARLGVLGVYRSSAGPLSTHALEHALAVAEQATAILLDGQARAGGAGAAFGSGPELESRFQVYQAQGMVMVQLGISPTAALARLRAYAYASERSLTEVARDIVAHKLRLDED